MHRELQVIGPFKPTGAGDTPSRRASSLATRGGAGEEAGCARRSLTGLATRAYRRPVAADDPRSRRCSASMTQGRAEGSFEAGIQRALARMLVDPEFLFRFEREPDDVARRAPSIASATSISRRGLSFFLWSSIPDDELLALPTRQAERAGRARAAGAAHAGRPEGRALVRNFAASGSICAISDAVHADDQEFDGNLRQALHKETELLFESIVREDRSVVDLLDADYTFVNERLARHYGMPNIRGSRFRRVELPETRRAAACLGRQHSHRDLGTEPHLAGDSRPVDSRTICSARRRRRRRPASRRTSRRRRRRARRLPMRERLEQHRANPSCACATA